MRKAGLLVLALAVATAVSLAAATPASIDDRALAQEALELVNRSRADQGLRPLVLKPPLLVAAEQHARDMKRRGYFAHVSPQGSTAFQRYLASGGSRWHEVAENIAHCVECSAPMTSDLLNRMHQGWMNSPGHRKNILLKSAKGFGFAAVGGRSGVYAVQTFSGTGKPRGIPPGEKSMRLAAGTPLPRSAARINSARRPAGAPDLRTDAALSELATLALNAKAQAVFNGAALRALSDAVLAKKPSGWAALAAVSGSCGACGPEVAETDASHFLEAWMLDAGYREILLNAAFDGIGMAITANGEGGKLALAVLGRKTAK